LHRADTEYGRQLLRRPPPRGPRSALLEILQRADAHPGRGGQLNLSQAALPAVPPDQRPDAGWPDAGWPDAGWPDAGWLSAPGLYPRRDHHELPWICRHICA
jgi:hypothetical protein